MPSTVRERPILFSGEMESAPWVWAVSFRRLAPATQ